ncbi:MAG: hypothetical protein LBH04_06405 [Tannerellaceae bacterium]|jgi:hypothetical protein|nr:hypothetical protein [Tannerellaceae bacterium]
MFVSKKKNRSGPTSVVVVDKRGRHFRELKTIGVSNNESEIDSLCISRAKNGSRLTLASVICFQNIHAKRNRKLINGTQLILNHVFKMLGFDKIDDEILKHLVVFRICQPCSKVATVDYLKSYYAEDVELHKIYRYLDKLQDSQKDAVQQK